MMFAAKTDITGSTCERTRQGGQNRTYFSMKREQNPGKCLILFRSVPKHSGRRQSVVKGRKQVQTSARAKRKKGRAGRTRVSAATVAAPSSPDVLEPWQPTKSNRGGERRMYHQQTADERKTVVPPAST